MEVGAGAEVEVEREGTRATARSEDPRARACPPVVPRGAVSRGTVALLRPETQDAERVDTRVAFAFAFASPRRSRSRRPDGSPALVGRDPPSPCLCPALGGRPRRRRVEAGKPAPTRRRRRSRLGRRRRSRSLGAVAFARHSLRRTPPLSVPVRWTRHAESSSVAVRVVLVRVHVRRATPRRCPTSAPEPWSSALACFARSRWRPRVASRARRSLAEAAPRSRGERPDPGGDVIARLQLLDALRPAARRPGRLLSSDEEEWMRRRLAAGPAGRARAEYAERARRPLRSWRQRTRRGSGGQRRRLARSAGRV